MRVTRNGDPSFPFSSRMEPLPLDIFIRDAALSSVIKAFRAQLEILIDYRLDYVVVPSLVLSFGLLFLGGIGF